MFQRFAHRISDFKRNFRQKGKLPVYIQFFGLVFFSTVSSVRNSPFMIIDKDGNDDFCNQFT